MRFTLFFSSTFSLSLFPCLSGYQFNDVILYTSRGMTATNQFKVHGQLLLRGMTVSAVSLSWTQSASNGCHQFIITANKPPPNSWTASRLPRITHTHTHTHIHILSQDSHTSPSSSLPFHHLSQRLFLSVYFSLCCPRSHCSLMFFRCFCVPLFRSGRVKMSGAYLTPSRWLASNSRWWWQQGRSGSCQYTDTLYRD